MPICFRVFLLTASLLLASIVEAKWHRADESIMGTRISLEFWMPDDSKAAVVTAAVMAEMRRIDQKLSTHKDDSQLSELNRRAGSSAFPVDGELMMLLDKSVYFGKLSQGAFDVTYASVGRYYDYRKQQQPEAAQRDALLPAIDYRHIELDRHKSTVRYRHPAVYVDLGGIAKGHAVDRAAALLGREGIAHASISAGGDSRILGDRRGRPWMVGIKNPRQGSDGKETLIRIPLSDTALSTSGDYERFFIDPDTGQRVHHILNPRTGASAMQVRSVTVLGPRGVDTDPLSTTVFVLGVEKGLRLIEQLSDFDCVIIDAAGKAHYSAGLVDPTVN